MNNAIVRHTLGIEATNQARVNAAVMLSYSLFSANDADDVPPAPDHDADGNPRPFGARVDIGAYEWRGHQTFLPVVRASCQEYCAGWGVGGKTILRTRDGGLTWEQQALPGGLPADFELMQVKTLDTNMAFVVGSASVLLRTTILGTVAESLPVAGG